MGNSYCTNYCNVCNDENKEINNAMEIKNIPTEQGA